MNSICRDDDAPDAIDYSFLQTYPQLRSLTLVSVHGDNESLLAVLPQLPHLEVLKLRRIRRRMASAARIGQLRARMLVVKPHCHVVVALCQNDPLYVDE